MMTMVIYPEKLVMKGSIQQDGDPTIGLLPSKQEYNYNTSRQDTLLVIYRWDQSQQDYGFSCIMNRI